MFPANAFAVSLLAALRIAEHNYKATNGAARHAEIWVKDSRGKVSLLWFYVDSAGHAWLAE